MKWKHPKRANSVAVGFLPDHPHPATYCLETGMSKINGDHARQNRRDRRNAKMREKMRAIREKLAQKSAKKSA